MPEFDWKEFFNHTLLRKIWAVAGDTRVLLLSGSIVQIDFTSEDNSNYVLGDGNWLVSVVDQPKQGLWYCRRFTPWAPRMGDWYYYKGERIQAMANHTWDPNISPVSRTTKSPIVILSRTEEKPVSVIDAFSKLMGV